MAPFDFGKENEAIRSVKVLGAGCKSCHEQYENAKEAAQTLGLPVEMEYVTDLQKVMAYGVMSMPAIVVNKKVVSMEQSAESRRRGKTAARLWAEKNNANFSEFLNGFCGFSHIITEVGSLKYLMEDT
ncbi:MAG: thioredoxin family protein [Treponemataceae bacterium]|nr:thioredoxin family protein [Treponemataceae bacterium]